MISSFNEARYERYYKNLGTSSIKPKEEHIHNNTYTNKNNDNKEKHNLAREYQKELMKMVSKYYEKGGNRK
ncbi:hypothetical protein CBE79_04605 [Priestia megaterium]|nr:hypothetical protein CBE78_02100 [Priestia megaterium]TPF22148.1 hypothetical protein CBE79_04605 [Priestia megaterium]